MLQVKIQLSSSRWIHRSINWACFYHAHIISAVWINSCESYLHAKCQLKGHDYLQKLDWRESAVTNWKGQSRNVESREAKTLRARNHSKMKTDVPLLYLLLCWLTTSIEQSLLVSWELNSSSVTEETVRLFLSIHARAFQVTSFLDLNNILCIISIFRHFPIIIKVK